LVYFDLEKEAIVEYDTSDKAVGRTLSQKDEKGKLHFIVYYLRKFIAVELNYDIHDKELLVIVEYLR
jgi:RNase H-like domain found in reverse transcriptase